jgi:imidazolonepropionase-like amidohydrolase
MSTQDFKTLIQTEAINQEFILENVNIFDGKNEEIKRLQSVHVVDGKITNIDSEIDGSNIFRIDGKEQFLMPGLIDSHTHVTGSGAVPWSNVKANIQYNLEAYLYAGITTVYDLGGPVKQLKKLSSKIKDQSILGPDLHFTHIPITIKNSHPIPLAKLMVPGPLGFLANIIFPTISSESDAKKLISKLKKKGVEYVKISCDKIPPGSPEMPFNLMKALIDETHKVGLKAFIHIGSVDNAIQAIKAGADVLAHGIWRDKLTEEEAKFIADSEVKIIYTLSGFINVDKINKGEFSPSEIDQKLIPCCVLDPVAKKNGLNVKNQKVMNAFFDNVSENETYWKHNFELLNSKGSPILVGTDSNLPGTYAGSTFYQEIYDLKEYGMSNFEVLKAATFGNAHLFMDNPNFGQIKVGCKANMLLFKENPLENINIIEQPSQIFKNGQAIKRLI